MKYYLSKLTATIVLSIFNTTSHAFTFHQLKHVQPIRHHYPQAKVFNMNCKNSRMNTKKINTLLAMSFQSDFPSAMPPKPEMTKEEKLYDAATKYISQLEDSYSEGVAPPPELESLRKSRDAKADASEMAAKIYELMIEQGMLYDQDAETGKLSPTNFDIKNNLDVPEVKQEFAHLYKYGMNLIAMQMIDIDTAKEIVEKRLIQRTGLKPEEFDAWLGY